MKKKTYIGFDPHEMIPEGKGAESKDISPQEVRRLVEEGAITKCLPRHAEDLNEVHRTFGITIGTKQTQRMQYLTGDDRYIEIVKEGTRFLFRVWKVR